MAGLRLCQRGLGLADRSYAVAISQPWPNRRRSRQRVRPRPGGGFAECGPSRPVGECRGSGLAPAPRAARPGSAAIAAPCQHRRARTAPGAPYRPAPPRPPRRPAEPAWTARSAAGAQPVLTALMVRTYVRTMGADNWTDVHRYAMALLRAIV